MLYDFTDMWNLKKTNSQIQRADWWLPEVQGEGMAELDEGG